MSHALRKLSKLIEAKRFYLLHPEGLADAFVAKEIGISVETAFRYRRELGCVEVKPHRYTYEPTEDDKLLAAAIEWRIKTNNWHE